MKFLKSKGFSLVEVMVAMGVASVVGLGLTQIMLNSNKNLARTNATSDFNTLVNLMQGVFNSSSNCAGAFPNFTFATPLPTASSSAPQNVPLPFTVVATVGSPTPTPVATTTLIGSSGVYTTTITVQSLQFTSLQPLVGTNQYMASLVMTALRSNAGGPSVSPSATPSTGQLTSQHVQHTFQIVLTLDANNKIAQCSGMSNSLWTQDTGNNSISFNVGNVGIGTTSPKGVLQVMGSINGSTGTMLAACDNTSSGIGWGVGVGTWNAQGLFDVVNPSNTTHMMTVTTSGVGFGTTMPTAAVEADTNSSSNVTTNLIVANTASNQQRFTNSGQGAGISFYHNDPNQGKPPAAQIVTQAVDPYGGTKLNFNMAYVVSPTLNMSGSTTAMSFSTQGSSTANATMNGNLTVNGNINISGTGGNVPHGCYSVSAGADDNNGFASGSNNSNPGACGSDGCAGGGHTVYCNSGDIAMGGGGGCFNGNSMANAPNGSWPYCNSSTSVSSAGVCLYPALPTGWTIACPGGNSNWGEEGSTRQWFVMAICCKQ